MWRTGTRPWRGHVVDEVFKRGSHGDEGVVHGGIFLIRHAVVDDRAAVADVEHCDHHEAHYAHGTSDKSRKRHRPQGLRLLCWHCKKRKRNEYTFFMI